MKTFKLSSVAVLFVALISISWQKSQNVQQAYAYDEDWNNIKTAIINKDIKGVGAYASNDEVDSEMLINVMHEPAILKQLRSTSYDDLETEEQGENVYLVFSAYETATDDEGNEVGSGISLYLLQGDPNLLIEYYIVAG